MILWVGAGLALAAGCSRTEGSPTGGTSAPSGTSLAATSASTNPAWDAGTGAPVRVAVTVSKAGFEPATARFARGRPAFLDFTRVDESDCLNAVKMPWSDALVDLPLRKTVSVQIPDTSRDGDFRYGCWMDMVFGAVVIEAGDAGP